MGLSNLDIEKFLIEFEIINGATKKYVDDNIPGTPNLQSVTDVGAYTTNNMGVYDGGRLRLYDTINSSNYTELWTSSDDLIIQNNTGGDIIIIGMNLSMGGGAISSLADPTLDQDAATKKYVDDNAFVSPLTTKGDLYAYTTEDSRLAVGSSNDMVLKVSSGEAAGLIYEGIVKVQTSAPEEIAGNIWLDTDDETVAPSNSDTVDGFHASQTPTANTILPLDSNGDLDLGDAEIKSSTSDQDILVKVNDGGTERTAIQVHGDSGVVSFPRQSHVYAYLSSNQTIANATTATIVFDTEVTDMLGEYDNATGIFTAKYSGVYHISSTIDWLSLNSSISYIVIIYANGAEVQRVTHNTGTASEITKTSTGSFYVSAGQTIYIRVYQGSGGNEEVRGFGRTTSLTIAKIA